MDRIKRLSNQILAEHKSKFGESFTDNKKILDQISIIRSKGLKNEIAGYITKFIKKELKNEKTKKIGSQSVNPVDPTPEQINEPTPEPPEQTTDPAPEQINEPTPAPQEQTTDPTPEPPEQTTEPTSEPEQIAEPVTDPQEQTAPEPTPEPQEQTTEPTPDPTTPTPESTQEQTTEPTSEPEQIAELAPDQKEQTDAATQSENVGDSESRTA